jgi:tRNA A37 threonylcarbamoyladenosine modification protein TsaB
MDDTENCRVNGGQLIRKYAPKPMAASTATLSIAFSCPHIPVCALQAVREHMTDMVCVLLPKGMKERYAGSLNRVNNDSP